MTLTTLPAVLEQIRDKAAAALFDSFAGGADADLMDMAAAIAQDQATIVILAFLNAALDAGVAREGEMWQSAVTNKWHFEDSDPKGTWPHKALLIRTGP